MSDTPLSTHPMLHGEDRPVHAFTRDGMGTTFGVLIAHDDESYARQAAHEAFDEAERLEWELSRFLEGSDVYRLNHAPSGQGQVVGIDLVECLMCASEACIATGGAFDPCFGGPADSRDDTRGAPSAGAGAAASGLSHVHLDETTRTVSFDVAGLVLDLGGIGKGFALDRMSAILDDWSIDAALLHAGQSTFLASGSDRTWRIPLRDHRDQTSTRAVVELKGASLSGSGRSVHGDHIIDPRTGIPARLRDAAWSAAPRAAMSDALSTAFMILTEQEIETVVAHHASYAAIITPESSDEPRMVGACPGVRILSEPVE